MTFDLCLQGLFGVLLAGSQEQVAVPFLQPEAHVPQGGVVGHALPLQGLDHLLVLHVVVQNVSDGKDCPLADD